MSKSIKLKNNNYWDSKGIVHNKELLSDILTNYNTGTTRKVTVVGSYVRLFTFEMSAIWKNTSILFYFNDTQNNSFSQLVNFSVKKGASETKLSLHTFKTLNFNGNISSQLVAVITDTNKIEVYFKMATSQSPTINIVAISKLEERAVFGKLNIDCNTVVTDLPNGDQKWVTNLL